MPLKAARSRPWSRAVGQQSNTGCGGSARYPRTEASAVGDGQVPIFVGWARTGPVVKIGNSALTSPSAVRRINYHCSRKGFIYFFVRPAVWFDDFWAFLCNAALCHSDCCLGVCDGSVGSQASWQRRAIFCWRCQVCVHVLYLYSVSALGYA